jgi:hypothetical protein
VIGSALWLLAYPDDPLIVVRKEFKEHVKPYVEEVVKCLENPVCSLMVKEKYGVDLKIRSNENTVNTNIPSTIKQDSLKALSIRGSLTGKHCSKIVTDDIVTRKDRYSKAEREFTKNVYMELMNVLNPGGSISNIGTPWHDQDCFRIMPEAKRYPIGTTKLKEFTEEHINYLRSDMTPSLFAANYELKHIADEDSLFTDGVFGEHPQGLAYRMHVDAAYKGKDTIAITIMAKKDDILYAIGWVFNGNIEDHYNTVRGLWQKYNCGTLYMEDNADKGLAATQFTRLGIPVSSYHEKENKHVKIIGHLYRDWSKIVWSTDTNTDYMEQIICYIEGEEPDDAPDSAACMCRIYHKGKTVSKLEVRGI